MSQETVDPVSALAAGAGPGVPRRSPADRRGRHRDRGLQLASISVVRTAPDGTEELEVIADAGDESGNEVIVGRRTPLASLLDGDREGRGLGPVPVPAPRAARDRGRRGRLRLGRARHRGRSTRPTPGTRSTCWWRCSTTTTACCAARSPSTSPTTAGGPGPEQRRLLEKFAEQAGRTVVTTLEREELAEQVRLADTARTIVRNASAQRDLERGPRGVPGRAGRGLPLATGRGSRPSTRTGAARARSTPRRAARSSCPTTSSSSPSVLPGAAGPTRRPWSSPATTRSRRASPPTSTARSSRSSTPSASARCCSSRSAPARSASATWC